MAMILLYFVCVSMIKGVLLKVFGGKNPSGKIIGVISLLALLWPIWPEIAVIALLVFVARQFIAFSYNNQQISKN